MAAALKQSDAEAVVALKRKRHAGGGAEAVAALARRAGVSCGRYCSIRVLAFQ